MDTWMLPPEHCLPLGLVAPCFWQYLSNYAIGLECLPCSFPVPSLSTNDKRVTPCPCNNIVATALVCALILERKVRHITPGALLSTPNRIPPRF